MGNVNETSVPDSEIGAITRDGFEGVDMDRITLQVSEGHENRSTQWKRGQHLFLEAAKKLIKTFPDVDWYLLADQDTTIRPHCLRTMLEFIRPKQLPLVIGDYHTGGKKQFYPTLMGGAGTLWNSAAAEKVDMEVCLRETMADGAWQGMNSDRKIAKCFEHFQIGFVGGLGMHQLREDAIARDRTRKYWYPEFDKHQCTISLHRLEAGEMLNIYKTDNKMLGCPKNAPLVKQSNNRH